MYAEVKGVRGRALGARAQGGDDEQEGTASEVVLHWLARAAYRSRRRLPFRKSARLRQMRALLRSRSRSIDIAASFTGWSWLVGTLCVDSSIQSQVFLCVDSSIQSQVFLS